MIKNHQGDATAPQASARRILFTAPRQIRIETLACPAPGPGEVLVAGGLSALSAGTESLVWRGEMPEGMLLDATIAEHRRAFAYPCGYGFARVGTVSLVGSGVDQALVGRRVFGFWPHQTRLCVPLAECQLLPDDLLDEDAVFLASMETAVSLLQDSGLVYGESLAVFGLGTIGLLVAALANESRAGEVWGFDPVEARCLAAVARGIRAEDPGCAGHRGQFDVVMELSANPLALDAAIDACRYAGRVVLGSWYGTKPLALRLGADFHRSRISLVASQVSTIQPELSGRWTKARRLQLALHACRRLQPADLISHRFALDQAVDAYSLAADQPAACTQIIFDCSEPAVD